MEAESVELKNQIRLIYKQIIQIGSVNWIHWRRLKMNNSWWVDGDGEMGWWRTLLLSWTLIDMTYEVEILSKIYFSHLLYSWNLVDKSYGLLLWYFMVLLHWSLKASEPSIYCNCMEKSFSFCVPLKKEVQMGWWGHWWQSFLFWVNCYFINGVYAENFMLWGLFNHSVSLSLFLFPLHPCSSISLLHLMLSEAATKNKVKGELSSLSLQLDDLCWTQLPINNVPFGLMLSPIGAWDAFT